jgi:transcriptional antiterminator NusG
LEGGFLSKNYDKELYFCLFCETLKEAKVETFLKRLGLNVISALVERKTFKNGKWAKELRAIIPGYVFFENNCEPDWDIICKNFYVYFPLHYPDKSKYLKGKDLDFINWLKRHNGLIKISKAIEIGTKVKILEGPLKELEGQIIKINKRQKCVCVNIEGEGIKNTIWLSYEIIS